MKSSIPAVAILLVSLSAARPPAARAAEIDVAREALRDGLWDVARVHAEASGGPDSRRIILESHAREGDWAAVLDKTGKWRDGAAPEDAEAISYYRALALRETGRAGEAEAALDAATFSIPEYRRLADGLRARLAADAGDKGRALKIIRESDFDSADADLKMSAAEILEASGDRKGAERIWREVAADTNAPPRALATAAANLSDAALLRRAVERAQDAPTRRLAGLRLGRLLVADAATFDEGARMIRSLVKDAPDAEGAKEAALALADVLLDRKEWQAAADAFRNALEIWPDAAQLASVQEGHGWALRRLGRSEEALEAFSRAEEAATDDEGRARAALAQGDVLSESGRSEEAMAKYRMVLEKHPETSAAGRLKDIVESRELESKGRDLYNDYRFAEAQKVFADLAERFPARSARARFFEVLCLYGQGMDDDAKKMAAGLAESADDETVRAEATLWLAKSAYNERRWEESIRLFASYADMMRMSPRAPGALVWAARAAFAENDFGQAIRLVTTLAERYPDSAEKVGGYLVQGEALMELGRYDEAVLVLERALLEKSIQSGDSLRAEVLKADALFALGADNPVRYREALDAYRAVRLGESLSPGMRLAVSFKLGRTLEKLKRTDEAIDQYYTGVVLAYREGRQSGVVFDDEARAAFARAAFRLADEYESRGRDFQAMHILELVVASDVPASGEAEKRLDRIQTKGRFL